VTETETISPENISVNWNRGGGHPAVALVSSVYEMFQNNFIFFEKVVDII
jgi:hypothetical protein